ncbi:PH domain-containing protein ECU06_0670 [Trichonephila clavipes]|nr:PH domain-containing protein ECU06_0670 [Trichonephila clavipes]
MSSSTFTWPVSLTKVFLQSAGQAKEVSKDASKGEISTLVDATDKTKKSRASKVNSIEKDLSIGNVSERNHLSENKKILSRLEYPSGEKSNSSLKSSNKINEKSNTCLKSLDEVNEKSISERSTIKNLSDSRIINGNTNKSEGSITEKKTLSMKKSPSSKYRNVEIAAGAAAVVLRKNIQDKEEDKQVIINEQENEEHEVSNDGRSIPLTESDKHNLRTRFPNSSGLNTGFSPQRIPSNNLHKDSGILTEREKNNVEAEGHFNKRRRIFTCFWHEKYFLLTQTGILKYYKANGTRVIKGNWDLKNIQRIHEVFMGGESHPFRLALMNGDENLLFGFDDSDNREYWLIKLSKYINK